MLCCPPPHPHPPVSNIQTLLPFSLFTYSFHSLYACTSGSTLPAFTNLIHSIQFSLFLLLPPPLLHLISRILCAISAFFGTVTDQTLIFSSFLPSPALLLLFPSPAYISTFSCLWAGLATVVPNVLQTLFSTIKLLSLASLAAARITLAEQALLNIEQHREKGRQEGSHRVKGTKRKEWGRKLGGRYKNQKENKKQWDIDWARDRRKDKLTTVTLSNHQLPRVAMATVAKGSKEPFGLGYEQWQRWSPAAHFTGNEPCRPQVTALKLHLVNLSYNPHKLVNYYTSVLINRVDWRNEPIQLRS